MCFQFGFAFALAKKFKRAIEAKMVERQDRLRQDGDPNPEANLIAYNVFVLTATLPEMLESLPRLITRFEFYTLLENITA